MNIIVAIAGASLVLLLLWDVFVVLVLTRRATRQFQLTYAFAALFRSFYAVMGRSIHDRTRREQYLSVFGPLFLFLRFAVWAVGLIVGYAVLQWAVGARVTAPEGAASFTTILYFSATNFFTLGLGDVVPQTGLSRLLAVTEAATGFGFLGLVVSYLPAFYQDYARREVRLSMLDEWAGSPPSAGELLRRLGRDGALSDLNPFLQEWENWCAQLLESHLSYPILAFFRSQHEDQSWLSALATILDVSALVLVGIEGIPPRTARLTFAMARHTAVDLGQTLGRPLAKSNKDRLSSDDLARLREVLQANNVYVAQGPEAENKLRELHDLYEPYLRSLSDAFSMQLPAWIPELDSKDNWQRSAEGIVTAPWRRVH